MPFGFTALLLTVCVIIIYLVYRARKDDIARIRARRALAKSSGDNDQAARDALRHMQSITRPTPRDRFDRGRVLQTNILGGDIPVDADAVLDEVIAEYTAALAEADERIEDQFMMDQIAALFDTMPDTPIVPAVPKQDKMAAAIAAAPTRAEAIDTYISSIQTYTDDRQNVHDSKVTSGLRGVVGELRKTSTGNTAESLAGLRHYIEHDVSQRDKAARAIRVLDRMAEGGNVSTYNEREDVILAAAWDRCGYGPNRENFALMREAVVDALADGIEHGTVVCAGGRTARVLNSFVQLDAHPVVAAGAMTYEAYKNQIYQETRQIIDDEIDRAKHSADPAMRLVAESYENPATEIDPAAERGFKEGLKQQIDRNLAQYDGILSADELGRLAQDCHLCADV